MCMCVVMLALFVSATYLPASASHNVQVNGAAGNAVLNCPPSPVSIYFSGIFWADFVNISLTSIHIVNFAQTPTGPGLSFGIGCDPLEPDINMTIHQVNLQGVLLSMDGTSLNGSIYGTFYYGDLGIPVETTFSEQIPIESNAYTTNYPAFVSSLISPAVYLNTTGRYVEWRLPATVNPQEIYFTNAPTHARITNTEDAFGRLNNAVGTLDNWLYLAGFILVTILAVKRKAVMKKLRGQ